MRNRLFLILFGIFVQLHSQEKHTLSGYVKDARNGENLAGATVQKLGTTIATSANEYGFFSLTLPAGTHAIAVALIGYSTFTLEVDLSKSVTRNFELNEEDRNLEEVEISAEAADKNVKSTEMGVARLDIKQIN